jgi:hypothetical protein
MTSGSSSRQERVEALKATLSAQHMVGQRGPHWRNHAVALNTLEQDLGYFGRDVACYDVDEPARDRLLAHARQDAAHALLNTTAILNRLRLLTWLVVGLLCLCTYILLTTHR